MESVDSTNIMLRNHISEHGNLSFLAAAEQTGGRGQGDHTWTSAPGENLTFSVLLRFAGIAPLPASESLFITRFTALSVVEYLASRGIGAGIKWPNDIYVNGKKICGILIDNIIEGAFIRESVIGIGLNVNQTSFPSSLPNPVSMSSLTGIRYDLRAELDALSLQIEKHAGMLREEHRRDELVKRFGELLVRPAGEP